MKVREVIAILSECDPAMDVAVEQIFREHRSITLRSVELINNCVVLKDHTVRLSQASKFVAFDGEEFEVPSLAEQLLKG
jgi:hypothetical protein